MKATFFTVLAALAASVIAAPFQTAARTSNALGQPNRAVTMKRSEFKNSGLLKRATNVVGANNKRADDIAESVNYILVLLKDDDARTDAYQDEVDAADPASVLGKRADDIAESVNYILVLLKDDDARTDAYQDEVDAADPASVLGKRADDIAESVNYILVLLKDDDARTDAYQDEVDAVANPAEVLG